MKKDYDSIAELIRQEVQKLLPEQRIRVSYEEDIATDTMKFAVVTRWMNWGGEYGQKIVFIFTQSPYDTVISNEQLEEIKERASVLLKEPTVFDLERDWFPQADEDDSLNPTNSWAVRLYHDGRWWYQKEVS